MMTYIKTAPENRKKNIVDLAVIILVSVSALAGYLIFMNLMSSSGSSGTVGTAAPGTTVLLQTLIGALTEFSIWGLGITIICVWRKESFTQFGLRSEKLLITLILSVLVCMPTLINMALTEGIHSYLPFQSVHFTKTVLASAFPVNIIGMVIIAASWGFFEGFAYVVISERINRLFQTKHFFLNPGAILCAIACIAVHAAIGLPPVSWLAGVCDFIIIYGMLLVRDYTGNAWGCVFIYFFFWNALA